MSESFFSADYTQARRRFLNAAACAGAEISSNEVGGESGLYIDAAIIGPAHGNTVVVTSGVHGIEGFFGSAVQLALLESMSGSGPALVTSRQDIRYVLIHAINPYGFHYLRRFNEDNIDLNRNFPGPHNSYSGAPPGYSIHNKFLNPGSPPTPAELFKLKALWRIWRYGMAALKESIATGQYEYPQGLFYGGREPAESTRIMMERFPMWLGQSSQLVHIDFHTGLGKYGKYKLLLNENRDSSQYQWYENTFDCETLEPLNDASGTAYPVCGVFGEWAQQQHSQVKDYRLVGAEFGTYGVVRVISALRAENRAHHFSVEGSKTSKRAKRELMECFCPADVVWRRQVIESGLEVIKQASTVL